MTPETRRKEPADEAVLSNVPRTEGVVFATWVARTLWLWFVVAIWSAFHGRMAQSGTMLVVLPWAIWLLLTAWSGRDYGRGSPWHRPATSLMILLTAAAFATIPFGIASEYFAVTATGIPWARLAFYVMFVGCSAVALHRTRTGIMPMTLLMTLSAGFFYAYGAVSIVNGWVETAPATFISAEVLSKDVEIDPEQPSSSHIYAYQASLKLLDDAVPGAEAPVVVDIRSEDFNRINPGMVITLSRHQGLLGCFWFLLDETAPRRVLPARKPRATPPMP